MKLSNRIGRKGGFHPSKLKAPAGYSLFQYEAYTTSILGSGREIHLAYANGHPSYTTAAIILSAADSDSLFSVSSYLGAYGAEAAGGDGTGTLIMRQEKSGDGGTLDVVYSDSDGWESNFECDPDLGFFAKISGSGKVSGFFRSDAPTWSFCQLDIARGGSTPTTCAGSKFQATGFILVPTANIISAGNTDYVTIEEL